MVVVVSITFLLGVVLFSLLFNFKLECDLVFLIDQHSSSIKTEIFKTIP